VSESPASPEPEAASSLSRALDILEAFSVPNQNPELSLATLYDRTGIPKSTLRRLLRNLIDRGYVRQDANTRLYRLGLRCWELGVFAIGGLDLHRTLTPYLEDLARTTREQVAVWLYEDGECVCVQRADSSQLVRSSTRLGTREPANLMASGRVLMAWRSGLDIERSLTGRSWNTAAIRRLLTELAAIRSAGYAVNMGERWPELHAVAAPVRDYSNTVICAVSVSGPAQRLDSDAMSQITEELCRVTAGISAELGYSAAEGA
jgi:IclR family KDG regulon transcriptional repressor